MKSCKYSTSGDLDTIETVYGGCWHTYSSLMGFWEVSVHATKAAATTTVRNTFHIFCNLLKMIGEFE